MRALRPPRLALGLVRAPSFLSPASFSPAAAARTCAARRPDPEKTKEAFYAHERRTHEADLCADLFADPRVQRRAP